MKHNTDMSEIKICKSIDMMQVISPAQAGLLFTAGFIIGQYVTRKLILYYQRYLK